MPDATDKIAKQLLYIRYNEAKPPPHGVYSINVAYKYADTGAQTQPLTVANMIMGVFPTSQPGIQTNLSTYNASYVIDVTPSTVHDKDVVYISGKFNNTLTYTVLLSPDDNKNVPSSA